MLQEDDRKSKFVRVVLYTKKEVWMSTRLATPMKGSLQVVFGKADEQESIVTAKKEINKETGLKVTQLQWLVNDGHYDYNIYIYNIKKFKS